MVPVWGCGGLGCSSPSLVVSSEGMRGGGGLGAVGWGWGETEGLQGSALDGGLPGVCVS